MAYVKQINTAPRSLTSQRTVPRPFCADALNRSTASRRRFTNQTALRVLNVTDGDFETEVLKADKPVLVDFWAPWCGPCKLVAPLMEWTEKEYGSTLKVVKVEHDPNPKLIEKYKVYGLPALMLFKDGAEIANSKREGAVTKQMLLAYLKKHAVIS